MKTRPDCSSISDDISKLSSNSDITEEVVLNRLLYLTDNNKKLKINQQMVYFLFFIFYYIIDEILVQVEIPPNPPNEFIPGPVS